jgi:hypothetical protein
MLKSLCWMRLGARAGRSSEGDRSASGVYVEPDRCSQVRRCTRRGAEDTRVHHSWSEPEYVSGKSCEMEAVCRRCEEVKRDVHHQEPRYEYVGEDCVQRSFCGRCDAPLESHRSGSSTTGVRSNSTVRATPRYASALAAARSRSARGRGSRSPRPTAIRQWVLPRWVERSAELAERRPAASAVS